MWILCWHRLSVEFPLLENITGVYYMHEITVDIEKKNDFIAISTTALNQLA